MSYTVFNEDASRMAVGNASGFQLYDLPPASTSYHRVRGESSLGGVSILCLLEKTSLIAVVGTSATVAGGASVHASTTAGSGGTAATGTVIGASSRRNEPPPSPTNTAGTMGAYSTTSGPTSAAATGGTSSGAVDGNSAVTTTTSATAGTFLSTCRFLQLYDLRKNEILTEMHFDNPVLAVRMNMKRLIVILEKQSHIFDIETMVPLPLIQTVCPPNKHGLGALSCILPSGKCFFAFPQASDRNETKGDVFVVDATDMKEMVVIPAHQNNISAMTFSPKGNMLATCSTKGTIIRVFSYPKPALLYTFRRGQKEAWIHSLCFSASGSILAACSNSGTLHLFNCFQSSGIVASAEGARSFAKIPVKEKTKCICGISQDERVISVAIADPATGNLLSQYDISKEKPKLMGEYPF